MATIREQALEAILAKLRLVFPDQDVARNRNPRSRVAAAGDVVLYDGEEAGRLSEMSPPYFIITWSADLQIFIQEPDSAVRDQCLDDLLVTLAAAFPEDNLETLGGLVQFVLPRNLDLLDEPVEGGADIKAAVINLEFEYGTSSSVG
ncbi:MAG: hypothetical protein COB49_00490 [Alphaproteobacteria bacterium]|nr:MAG: hypothetical protein COB49_00490 [Alphaproteobacteria bacterium]